MLAAGPALRLVRRAAGLTLKLCRIAPLHCASPLHATAVVGASGVQGVCGSALYPFLPPYYTRKKVRSCLGADSFASVLGRAQRCRLFCLCGTRPTVQTLLPLCQDAPNSADMQGGWGQSARSDQRARYWQAHSGALYHPRAGGRLSASPATHAWPHKHPIGPATALFSHPQSPPPAAAVQAGARAVPVKHDATTVAACRAGGGGGGGRDGMAAGGRRAGAGGLNWASRRGRVAARSRRPTRRLAASTAR